MRLADDSRRRDAVWLEARDDHFPERESARDDRGIERRTHRNRIVEQRARDPFEYGKRDVELHDAHPTKRLRRSLARSALPLVPKLRVAFRPS